MSLVANVLNNIEFTSVNFVSFTSNGTYTPSADVKYVWVEVVGGGGSGGRAAATGASTQAYAGGGGGGGYAAKLIQNPAPATIVIGLGASGIGGGSDGGATSYDDTTHLLTGAGGLAAENRPALTAGIGHGAQGVLGGAGTGGDINLRGGTGGGGFNAGSDARGKSGGGGSTKYGTGAKEVVNTGNTSSQQGTAGAGFGAGGAGSGNGRSQAARDGGDGTDGVVFIWEII